MDLSAGYGAGVAAVNSPFQVFNLNGVETKPDPEIIQPGASVEAKREQTAAYQPDTARRQPVFQISQRFLRRVAAVRLSARE